MCHLVNALIYDRIKHTPKYFADIYFRESKNPSQVLGEMHMVYTLSLTTSKESNINFSLQENSLSYLLLDTVNIKE